MAVSKALFGKGGTTTKVSEETARRVREVAKKLGYEPNVIAQQLAGKRSNVIGVIIDTYAPEIAYHRLSYMERCAASHGYRFMVGQSHDDVERVMGYISDFATRGIDGVICLSHDYPQGGKEIAAAVSSRLKNVVFISRPALLSSDACFVEVDVKDGIGQAVDHLVRRSRRRIGMLLWSSQSTAFLRRKAGYVEALTRHGLPVHDDFIGLFDMMDGKINNEEQVESAVRALVIDLKVDAILAVNDMTAFRVINCLKRLNYRVPEQVAVIGYDDSDFAPLYCPALTTINQRNADVAKAAVELLIAMIEGREISADQKQVLIKPKLVIRDSA